MPADRLTRLTILTQVLRKETPLVRDSQKKINDPVETAGSSTMLTILLAAVWREGVVPGIDARPEIDDPVETVDYFLISVVWNTPLRGEKSSEMNWAR
jgi:hypothetical protein